MKLKVFHHTRYVYNWPVRDSYNEVRLQPLVDAQQSCQSFVLKILPPVRLAHFHDLHQNRVHYFEIPDPHSELVIESLSIVKTFVRPLTLDATNVPLDRLPEFTATENCHEFLQNSEYVELSPEVWRLAIDATAEKTDTWQAAAAIMHFTHSEFIYEKNATTVRTHMRELLKSRRGVCQDFAHVMLGMCRSIKIPARYVSGYLYSGPTDHLTGYQASHAWIEVFLPGLGWQGLDPTNNQPVDERYVRIAIGRDYADIAPVSGSYRGTREKIMDVRVRVTDSDH